eukprot:41802-Prymnesium_polylepis.1
MSVHADREEQQLLSRLQHVLHLRYIWRSVASYDAAQPIDIEAVELRAVPPVPDALQQTSSWSTDDYASAASKLASLGLLDRALLYLHHAALTSSDDDIDRWLSFGRALVALASADPPYPLAADEQL